MMKEGWKYKWTLPALYGWAYDNHFAPITNPDFQKSLRERAKSSVVESDIVQKQKGGKKQKKTEEDTEGKEETYAFIEATDNNEDKDKRYMRSCEEVVAEILDYEQELAVGSTVSVYILKGCNKMNYLDGILCEYIMKTHLIPTIKTSNSSKDPFSCIAEIILKSGNKIHIDNDILKRQEICEKLSIPFRNKSISSIAMDQFNSVFPDLKKSMLSHEMLCMMDNEAKPSIFNGFLQENVTDELVAIDFPKFYGTSFETMPLDFPIFTIFDEAEPYCPNKSDNGKKAGWYFVKTDNVIPAQGNGWYNNVTVNHLQKHNIEHQITHMRIASRCVPGNHFVPFIKMMIESLGKKDAKLLINGVIENFGKKTTRKSFKSVFTQSQAEAVKYYHRLQAEKWGDVAFVRKFHKKFHDFDLFQVTALQNIQTFSTHRPLRKQIIDYANCMLYDFIMDVVGNMQKVVAVKTDCIVVRKKDVYMGNLHKYRIEKRIPLLLHPLNKPNLYQTPVLRSWTRMVDFDNSKGLPLAKNLLHLLGSQSARIQAPAGYGKSFLLKGVQEELTSQGLKVKILAPTNTAADNVDGISIHKGLCITEDDIARLLQNLPDVVLIDEISQVPGYLWEIIYIYKAKGTRVFLFGDGNQLPPVELGQNFSNDYLNCTAVQTIADGNLITLKTNHRFVEDPSNRMHEFVDNIMNDSKEWMDELVVDAENITKYRLNIAYTNRMCQHINHLHMERLKSDSKKKALISDRIPLDAKTQDCYLIKGCPLIARVAIRKQGVIKGTRWTLKDWDEKIVVCRDDKYGRDCKVPRGMLQKHFLPGFCTTVHKAQGQTFNQSFLIHEKEKMSKLNVYDSPEWWELMRERMSFVDGCTFQEFITYIQKCLNASEDLKGAAALRKLLKKEGVDLSLKIVKDFLTSESSHQIHRKKKRLNLNVARTEAPFDVWESDWLSLGNEAHPESNKGCAHILICVDKFSKM
ncbi:hypothetical protein PhCBS80983_g06367, partial [Powellomyces hirtus]